MTNKLAILTASGLTFLGNGMHFIAMSWLVLEITDNPFYVSMLVIAGIIPGIISSPFAGAFADRYNRKFITIGMDLFRMIIVLSIPISSIFFGHQLWVLYIATVFLTLGSNFFFPAISSLIKTSFSKDEYVKVLSANSTLIQIGMIGGAGFAGFIIANYSINIVFYVDAITYLLSALCLTFIKYKPLKLHNSLKKKKQSLFNDISLGFKYVTANNTILFLILIGAIPNSLTYVINSLLGSYTKDVLNLGAPEYGILDASFAIGFVIIGIFLALKKTPFKEKHLLSVGLSIMSISLMILYFSNTLLVGIIALALMGISIVLTSPSIKSLLMKEVSDEYVGRVESFNWMLFSTFSPIVAVIATFIANNISIEISFFIFSILILSLIPIFQIFFKKKNIISENISPEQKIK